MVSQLAELLLATSKKARSLGVYRAHSAVVHRTT